jgi:hypothetical protein
VGGVHLNFLLCLCICYDLWALLLVTCDCHKLLVDFLACLFQRVFGVPTLEKSAHDDFRKLASAIYLQVSTISQALIFVTRSRSWSFVERPGLLLVVAFIIAQLVSQLPIHFILGALQLIKRKF